MPDYLELRRPTEASAICTAAFNQAMIDLSVMSEVAAAHVGAETARLKPTGNAPKGSRGALIAVLDKRWKRATCEYDRLLIIKDAQQAVRDNKYAPHRSKVRGTLEWKLAIAIDQRPSLEVAVQYEVSSSYVRVLRMRLQAGELK